MKQREFTQYFPAGWMGGTRPGGDRVVPGSACSGGGGYGGDLFGRSDPGSALPTSGNDDRMGKGDRKPVYNAIVWQCRRTAAICEQLKRDGMADYIMETTGLVIDAYFSATKIKWILDHVDGARERAEKGNFCSARWIRGCCGT